VSRTNLLASLLLVASCSDRAERSALLLIPGAADSLSGAADEQPALVLRCLAGRVDAYLMSPAAEPGDVADQGVPVELDSVPPCVEPAP